MSILNYFFIGTVFTFIVDFILEIKIIKNHPKMKPVLKNWGWKERTACITIWPIAMLTFFGSFLASFFKK